MEIKCRGKYWMIAAVVMLSALLMAACSKKQETVYTVVYQNKDFVIDTENQTIAVDGNVYEVHTERDRIEITYPNGATYWWENSDGGGYGGWSEGYDNKTYINGLVLVRVLSSENKHTPNPANRIPAILLMIFGILNATFPYFFWYISHGWYYKNAEPSDLALGINRFGGIAVMVFSVLLFFT